MRRSIVVLALALAACGGQSPPKATSAPAPSARGATAAASAAPLPANAIRRSALREVLAGGLGAFLQYVTLDDQPTFVAGKFHGFRIAVLRNAPFWRGVDLKPGDVITRVNGMPIEHPEEALEAFKSLEVASELRVDYERDGAPRELRFTIVEDEPKQADASALPSR